MSIPLLYPNDYTFPDPFYALEERDGLVGISRDLDTGRLLLAYRQGIFPWFSENGWFFWYTIDPRAVIVPENLHIGRSYFRLSFFQLFLVDFCLEMFTPHNCRGCFRC